MTVGLTPKQERLWRFIASSPTSPSLREMCDAVGTKSFGSIKIMVERLEERGYLSRTAGKWRSYVALDRPVAKPSLTLYSDAELIKELERRTREAKRRPQTPLKPLVEDARDELPRGDWRYDAKAGSARLLAAIDAAGLRP